MLCGNVEIAETTDPFVASFTLTFAAFDSIDKQETISVRSTKIEDSSMTEDDQRSFLLMDERENLQVNLNLLEQ